MSRHSWNLLSATENNGVQHLIFPNTCAFFLTTCLPFGINADSKFVFFSERM